VCLTIIVWGGRKNIIIHNLISENHKIIYKTRVVVVAAPTDLINCEYRPSRQVIIIIIKVCMCSFVLCRTGFQIEIGHDPHSHYSTLLRVRLSAGMSLCSFFYIIFFPCNSSEDIPLPVQRAVSYEPNNVRGGLRSFFRGRPSSTADARRAAVWRVRSCQRCVGVSKGDYGRTEWILYFCVVDRP